MTWFVKMSSKGPSCTLSTKNCSSPVNPSRKGFYGMLIYFIYLLYLFILFMLEE